MKYKHIIFDWDGTLADTYPVISAAYDYTFDKLGLARIPYDEVKRITSTLQNKDTLGYVFGERKSQASEAFYEYIREFHTEKLSAMPGAKELLDFCRQQGLDIYLITNKKTQFIAQELEKLGFKDYFKKVVAAGEYAEDKPHPIAAHALFNYQLPEADTILLIGDGEADIRTAKTYNHDSKNATCVIYDPQHKFEGSAPDYRVENLIDIIQIITKE